jgi:hypothetical protein
MRSSTVKLLVCALIIEILCLPSALSAKARRGALVVLTKVDGAEVKGELVSVKPDSLLLLKSGDALTIPRVRVHSVTIMRRSRMASGALTGFTAGVLAGVSWGLSTGYVHGVHPSVTAGAFAGVLGLAIGMAVSRGEKVESVIPLAGLTGPAADENWDKLRAYSKEGRLK